MRRFFLVGCPRSGTTLLQSMIARHPAVFTFPETHYFRKIRGRFGERDLGIVSPRAASRVLDGLVESIDGGARPSIPRWWLGTARYGQAFTETVDHAAASGGAMVWLEKSPIHLHHMSEIERVVPDVRFIHLVRDGRDVVASLFDVCERDAARWVPQLIPGTLTPSRADLVDAATARWNGDIALTTARVNEPHHRVFRYESLIDNPRDVLTEICAFMGLNYDHAMERHWETADDVLGWRATLPHMEKTSQPLEDRRGKRFETIFTAGERSRIVGRLLYSGDPGEVIEAQRVTK